MDNLWEEVRRQVLQELDLTKEITDEQLQEKISIVASGFYRQKDISIRQRVETEEKVFNALRKFDILQELIDDPDVTEIMVNGPSNIFYERDGQIHPFCQSFSSEEKLSNVIQNICYRYNRSVNLSSPIVDTRLPDGSRVNIVLSPIALGGSVISIRKFPNHPFRMEELVEKETLTFEAASFLEQLVKSRYSIFVSGGTSSGKTTFLNALSQYIPPEERIITIEDSAELQLQGLPNLVRLETRAAVSQNTTEITIRQLIKTALRMRPDRIIVGECRGAEALDMLSAMNTGHDGSLSTGHANSTKDILNRIETMILMGMQLPLLAIRQQMLSGIDILIQMQRMSDRSRKVIEIAELDCIKDGEIILNPLFIREQGRLLRVGELKHLRKWNMCYGGDEHEL